jgi:predicted metalloprotease with PDZ domain
MKIFIKKHAIEAQTLEIQIEIESGLAKTEIVHPIWRPGRYEIQNFSKNISSWKATSLGNGKPLNYRKTSKNTWVVQNKAEAFVITIHYYANKQDAGNSYLADDVFYLNFVNCVPYTKSTLTQAIQLTIQLPSPMPYACGLGFSQQPTTELYFTTDQLTRLYDSPFIAHKQLSTQQYTVKGIPFYMHFAGYYQPNWSKLLPAFQAFTKLQINTMGTFPEKDYHFIHWILPTAYYHGVEHANNTMIVLGPDTEAEKLIPDILGIDSHELFHAWNICKIRPKELLPYHYGKETYFDTGFVAEGVTTYLGDLFLLHSGVISPDDYQKELLSNIQRHFSTAQYAGLSLAESSMDLWMDGYGPSVPNKNVSIYAKGALVAFILDVHIRKHTGNKSIYNVMQLMWDQFGTMQKGYTQKDYQKTAESVFGKSLKNYMASFINGTEDIRNELSKCLQEIGLQLTEIEGIWSLEGPIGQPNLPNFWEPIRID